MAVTTGTITLPSGPEPGSRVGVPDVPGLARQRVLEALHHAVEHHAVVLLVAPAGSGKTTELVQFVRTTSRRTVWCHADAAPTRPSGVLDDLVRSLRPGTTEVVDDVDGAISALQEVPPAPTVAVIDDLHELGDPAAEQALERFARRMPSWMRLVAATRHTPGFNHSRLRVSQDLVQLTEDDLRWRPWEVERLFRDYYRTRLRPEEAALLTQRTEGWVAGLQLFHLATRDLPLAGRTQLIDGLHTRPGLVRDYLTHNVLAELPRELRDFLVDTCVLGRLDQMLCDQLRDRTDSGVRLAELEDKRLFLVPREDGLGYRYHEVLRAHLEICLLERDGAMASRARFHRAGQLLEAADATTEALHAYTRAEAWQDVARLLGSDGPSFARGGQALLGALPRSLVVADPWLRLAQARALLGDGRLGPAIAAYRDAESAFEHQPAARICRDERTAVQPWIEGLERPPRTLTDRLRAAVRGDPRRWAGEARDTATPRGLLAASVALLLAGSTDEARRTARDAGNHPDAEVFSIAAARALEHVTSLLSGTSVDPTDLPWAAETFEQVGSTWLARLARTVANCRTPDGLEDAEALWGILDEDTDPWGPPILRLAAGIAAVVHDRPDPDWLDEAALAFRRLGGGTLEAWARAWEALARARVGDPEPVALAEQARSLARHAQVPGAEGVAELAIATTGDGQAPDAEARARAIANELGLALPAVPPPPPDATVQERVPPSQVRCLGGLALSLHGEPVDTAPLKPQGRALLALTAMQAGTPVHRDHLIDVLWPDDDPDTARRRLSVVVSTVRRHLEPDTEPGEWTALVRRGEAYVLQVPPDTYVDVHALDDAAATARAAHASGDEAVEMAAHRAVLDAYGGDLLPEFGPAEWLVDDRERYRVQVVHAAQARAAWELANGDPLACVETANDGLRVDRYRTPLWCLLADAHRALGDLAAAVQAEDEHAAVLEDLGIETGCCPSMDPAVVGMAGGPRSLGRSKLQ